MENKFEDKSIESMNELEQVDFIVKSISSDVIVHNIAMWLDLAIAKGRYLDKLAKENAVSESDNDKKQEVSENE